MMSFRVQATFVTTIWARVLLLLFINLAPCAYADIKVFHLQNLKAKELVSTIQPMLGKEAVITAKGYQLIVKSSKEDIHSLEQLIPQLDLASQQLIISVIQGDADFTRSANKQTRLLTTVAGEESNKVQTVKVMAGKRAHIRFGSTRQITQHYHTSKAGKVIGKRRSEQQLVTGMYVTPRMRGEQVMLELERDSKTASMDSSTGTDTHSFATTVVVPLGEWVKIGGTSTVDQTGENVVIFSTTTEKAGYANIFVKVEMGQ